MRAKQHKVAENKSQIVADLPLACADETAAVEFFERMRWGDEKPGCPHCGECNSYKMTDAKGQRSARFLWRCHACKKQFTVRVGTVLEDSRIPLRHWAYAFWRACTSKKGASALEIKRQTGLSYKSALFLMHRIRFAMAPTHGGKLTGIVEVDETYIGGKPRKGSDPTGKFGRGTTKQPVVGCVERGGDIRLRVVPDVTGHTLRAAVHEHVDKAARLMTDEWRGYRVVGREFASHETVQHSAGEYARGDVHTNTIEGFFAILKRGIIGVYHNVSRTHLHRYLAEFEFRYNGRKLDDGARVAAAILGAVGKRLMYREPAA